MMPWRYRPCPEHHWELGNGYSARKITRLLAKHWDVVHRGFIPENPYHYLWQLRSRSPVGAVAGRSLPGARVQELPEPDAAAR